MLDEWNHNIYCSIILGVFKHLTVRAVSSRNILLSAVYTGMIQISWLASSALVINDLLKDQWLSVFAYIAGGVVGSTLQFKIKI